MSTIYKVVTKPGYYPRACALKKGDRIYLVGSRDVKVGDKYEDHPAIISHIDYKPKKWWQFWKKKEMIGCQVLWVGDESEEQIAQIDKGWLKWPDGIPTVVQR